MSDLVEFLLARIAEDEEYANSLAAFESFLGSAGIGPSGARLLAECEAKRRIVAVHERVDRRGADGSPVTADDVCSQCAEFDFYPWEGVADEWPCPTLRALTLPYADHPDYRDEWRP